MFVNITAKCYQAGHIENLRWDRPFVWPISSNIEPLRRRIRKNTMVSVVEVREFYSCADLHWQKRRKKCQIFLCDLFRCGRSRFGKGAIEVDHGKRRLGREHAADRDDLIAFGHHRRGMRFRQFYVTFYDRIRENCNGEKSEYRIEEKKPS